ncbi:MAG: hypothetical protein IPM38_11925 [Ignavibacteria bacterium]|nr:hypothetical protein [Ignavibacteria bacterium]
MNESNLNMVIGIAEIVFFATLTVLAIYLIISLKKFLSSITKIEKEVIEITDRLEPVLTDMKFVTDDIREIADRVKFQYNKIEEVSDSLITKGQDVVTALDSIRFYSKNLLDNGLNFISAISNGFRTFKDKLTDNTYRGYKNVI